MKPARRLWVLEPMLFTEQGHYYAWARSIVSAAARRGWDVTVLASSAVEPAVRDRFATDGHELVPFFATYPVRSPRVFKQLIGAKTYRDGVAYVRRRANPDDVALTFSGQLEYAAAGALECRRRALPCPLVVQFFSWDHFTPATRPTAALHGVFVAAAKRSIRAAAGTSFRVAGQTAAIAASVERQLDRPVGIMPFPLDWTALGDESGRPERSPVVGYLGGARDEKGFPAFVDAVAQLEPPPPIFAQTFKHPHDPPDPDHLGRVDRLRSLGATVVDHGLYGEEFGAAFAAVDVVVLPYRAAEYAERNSSLLAEALGLGKVVVAPDGTWLGDTLRDEGVGVPYDPSDPDALVRAIEAALADFDTLRLAAVGGAAAWRRRHSPDGFLDALLDVAR